MPGLFPDMQLQVNQIPQTDGFQLTPPVAYVISAERMNLDSGATVDGQYDRASGEVLSTARVMMQDTHIGGAGLTGRPFTVVTGGTAVRDDWVSPWSNRHGISFEDGTAGATFDVRSDANSGGIGHHLLVLRRGCAPPDADHDRADVKLYIELAYDSEWGDYRIALEWGQRIRLDYFDPYLWEWRNGVASCSRLPNVETYLANNGDEIRILIHPDKGNDVFYATVGEGHQLKHSPPRPPRPQTPNSTTPLPSTERYRISGTNGWWQFQMFPLRYGPLSVTPAKRQSGIPYNTRNAQVFPLGSGRNASRPGEQTQSATVAQNSSGELEVKVTGSMPDAGDGEGSEEPASFAGVFVYIPAEWTFGVGYSQSPPLMHVEERETWDPILRLFSSSARFTINNRYGAYTGNFGNFSYDLTGGTLFIGPDENPVGGQYVHRQRGILAGGFTTHRMDPMRIMQCTGFDKTYTMNRATGQELQLDQWCIYSAVRLVAEIGQMHPSFLTYIPYWPPGPAGYDCPYPILGRGSGLNPTHEYGPERTPMSILLELVQEAGIEGFSGQNIPFMTGPDPWGNLRFEPYDPRNLPISARWTDWSNGLGEILEISAYDSVEQLRTDLIFQGQDWATNELLHYSLPLPANMQAVGYRLPWVERNERWATPAYVQAILRSAAIQASLPTTIVRLKVYKDNFVHAGQLAYIEDRYAIGRGDVFVIEDLYSRSGLTDFSGRRGDQEHYMWVTARSATNYIPF